MKYEVELRGESSPNISYVDGDEGRRSGEEENEWEELRLNEHVERDLNVTDEDLDEAKRIASRLKLTEVREMMEKVLQVHEYDPLFPGGLTERIRYFLENEEVFTNPEKHELLINEMKVEAALITNNSPYAEVRSVVSNRDTPEEPSSTIRSWTIGLVFSCILGFVNQLFIIRQPPIMLFANVAQLLSYPVGIAWAAWVPDWGFTLNGVRHSLNPGPFTRKEHMLITIMANVAYHIPYTTYIVWVQYLPQFFNQEFAGHFGYQILISLSVAFLGYGLAGICRRFLVYPPWCVWPASLVTIALNSSFHAQRNLPVIGPRNKVWTTTRRKFFLVMFGCMSVWFWLPGYIWTGLSYFSWLSWINPDHVILSSITGFRNGLGINPFPTMDWNILVYDEQDPLMVPFFSTINRFIGMVVASFVTMALWFTNAYNTAYMPINSNKVFDHFGKRYNVSLVVDKNALIDLEMYRQYSPPFLSAGFITTYTFWFGIYACAVSYAFLYHRREILLGLRAFWSELRTNTKNERMRRRRERERAKGEKSGGKQPASRDGAETEAEHTTQQAEEKPIPRRPYGDIHNRLMEVYEEVPELWYCLVLIAAAGIGIAGIVGWETHTSPAVVFYGVALCLIFMIPLGIIKAITGIEITLNVLAEFIGGSWVAGNALAMNFFKTYGYATCAHALWFSNDLKLAHYIKIPPRQTFAAQMVATLVSTFVCVGVLNYQLHIPDVCTPDAPFGFTCPPVTNFFSASVMWGTIGPKKIWGAGGQYTATLVGFPIGFALPFILYAVQRRWKGASWLRQAHPVVFLYGMIQCPYNLSYLWPSVPIAWLSWVYFKSRFLALWSKYNFVLSAAFSCGVAITGILIFFTLTVTNTELDWWGNDVTSKGCEKSGCVLLKLPPGEYFGPRIGEFE